MEATTDKGKNQDNEVNTELKETTEKDDPHDHSVEETPRVNSRDTVEVVRVDNEVDQYFTHVVASGAELSNHHHFHGENDGEVKDSYMSDASINIVRSEWMVDLEHRRPKKSQNIDEGHEGSDEEESEEEDDEEEEEEEENDKDDEDRLIAEAEAAEAFQKKRSELIDSYLIAKKEYNFIVKKNAYLQDKLYKICLRKGFIVENKGIEEDEKRKKKKGKFTTAKALTGNQDNEETMPEGMDDEEEQAWEAAVAEHNESIVSQRGTNTGIKNFLEAALESKYVKVVGRIWEQEKSKMIDQLTQDANLNKLKEKSKTWEKIHQEKFDYLMDRVRQASNMAIDSNTGRHLHHWETEQYVEEISKIRSHLCKTTVKMYQNRGRLNFSLKLLEQTEIQGEGLQMLEYEQLQAENYSLKEKLEDRQKDVENIKTKIAHAVQILAHFREYMNKLQEKMDDGNSKLSLINKRVYQVREITDVVTQRYEVYKEDEKNLVSESGLLDNTNLLRDFEKTHYDVLGLKERKRKLQNMLATKMREIEELQSKIRNVEMNLPELQALAKKKEQVSLTMTMDEVIKQDLIEEKRKKIQRLEYLLEKRTIDPKHESVNTKKYNQIPSISSYKSYKCI